jgi:hypothetical protein
VGPELAHHENLLRELAPLHFRAATMMGGP